MITVEFAKDRDGLLSGHKSRAEEEDKARLHERRIHSHAWGREYSVVSEAGGLGKRPAPG
jgi:hypothetical protein